MQIPHGGSDGRYSVLDPSHPGHPDARFPVVAWMLDHLPRRVFVALFRLPLLRPRFEGFYEATTELSSLLRRLSDESRAETELVAAQLREFREEVRSAVTINTSDPEFADVVTDGFYSDDALEAEFQRALRARE